MKLIFAVLLTAQIASAQGRAAGEVWYTYSRRISEQNADERIGQLRLLGVEFVAPDWELTRDAARFKAKHAVAYADCFAASLAKHENARIVTGDPEFEKLAREVAIVWV
jgi:predicted nucleic acid-binding protein